MNLSFQEKHFALILFAVIGVNFYKYFFLGYIVQEMQARGIVKVKRQKICIRISIKQHFRLYNHFKFRLETEEPQLFRVVVFI